MSSLYLCVAWQKQPKPAANSQNYTVKFLRPMHLRLPSYPRRFHADRIFEFEFAQLNVCVAPNFYVNVAPATKQQLAAEADRVTIVSVITAAYEIVQAVLM